MRAKNNEIGTSEASAETGEAPAKPRAEPCLRQAGNHLTICWKEVRTFR